MRGGADLAVGRLLVVDDRRVLAESLCEELSRRGIDVAWCQAADVASRLTTDHFTHLLLCAGTDPDAVANLGPADPSVIVLWAAGPEGVRTGARGGRLLDPACEVDELVAQLLGGGHPRVGGTTRGAESLRAHEDTAAAEDPSSELQLVASLTTRESEILEHLVSGAGGVAIADRLRISPHTVRTHVQNILSKLDVGSRHEATAIARRAGMRARPVLYEDGIPA